MDPTDLADRQWRKEARFHARRDPDEATWLTLVGGDFGHKSCGGEPPGARQSRLAGDGAQQFVGRGKRRAVEALRSGEIEIGLIDRDHLDDGRKSSEDRGDAVAPLRIFLVMAVEEHGVRAELSGGAQRHRGMNAVFASFVAGGRNDSALIRAAAHDYGLSAQFGAFKELDRDEKRVHVHMEDGRL